MQRSKKRNQPAFTLIEIMVSVSLLAIVLATIGPSLRRTPVSTRGTAEALAAAFTEARQQAIAQQVPVALVIPSGSGGQADSYYIVSGDQPRVSRAQRLSGDQPGVRLMVGHWPLNTAELKDPTLTTTITPPPGASLESDFLLDGWGLPNPNDFAFVFTPRGRLLTNDLPSFDGSYHVVVSHGGSATAASAPGVGVMTTAPTLFGLNEVGSPYTVNLDPDGKISVGTGLTANGGVTQTETAALTATMPDPPVADPPPTGNPVVTSVKMLPDPAKLDLPAGVDMLLAPNRHLSITVRAKSPEKVPLFCQWSADLGGLSSSKPVRMTYIPQDGEWEAAWQWQPPASGISEGDLITLHGRVTDGYSHQVSALMASSTVDPVVQVGDNATMTLAFVSDSGQIHLVNSDGTGLTALMDPGIADLSVYDYGWGQEWSPDGQRFVYESQPSGVDRDVFLMNADGSGKRNLTNDAGYSDTSYDGDPSWSPDGRQIVWVTTRATGPSEPQIFAMNADGGSPVNLSNAAGESDGNPTWSPDGTKIAFTRAVGGANLPWVMNANGTGQVPLGSLAQFPLGVDVLGGLAGSNGDMPTEIRWSPDSLRVAWGASDGSGNSSIYRANADGSGTPLNLGSGSRPVWMGDDRIYFRSMSGAVSVMNSDGSAQMSLGVNECPVWTPNPNLVGFYVDVSGLPRIVRSGLMNSDGSGQRILTNRFDIGGYPEFR